MIDLGHFVLIGDKVGDIQAGTSADVGINLFLASSWSNEINGVTYKRISTLQKTMPYLSGVGQ